MALLKDILKWTESLPSWQRDACRRLLQKEDGLDDADYSDLYLLLKKESGIDIEGALEAIPLVNEHLPVELPSGDTVSLIKLYDLNNVNQISSGHELAFSEKGLTVIYGGNGSGKSGYARVMKRACRARDQSETVHPNVNDPDAEMKVPTAKFDVKVAGVVEEIEWSRDVTPPDRLSTIAVFDSKCARSYVTAEKEAAYLPYGLDIVENLATLVLPKLTEKLEAEISCIDVSRLPFEHLLGETEVGKTIEKLSAKSDREEISALGTLTDKEIRRISDLEATLKEDDPITKAEELRLSAVRFKAYAEKMVKPVCMVSEEAIKNLQEIAEENNIAESAENNAANVLRAGEKLLPGTGDKVWKQLFEAARRYAIDAAYPDGVFPPLEDKQCPLCQQNLAEAGIQRLKRFDEFIKNDVAITAENVRKKIEAAKQKIEEADLQIVAEEALREELEALDQSLPQTVSEFQASIESRRKAMLECLKSGTWTGIPVLSESPHSRVRQLAAMQLRARRMLMRAADEDTRKSLGNELMELSARRSLSKSLNAVLELLDRMKSKESLETCRDSLKTRRISDKSKEFATVAVTEELKIALDKEFEALGIGHIKTRLKERSVRGKMFHQLLLDIPNTNKIDEILSEGEQRAIALGSFFAELAIANHSCGIVFDDPVSSLDHWRRRNVARRLVEEAMIRQVIVFTHDTSFLGQLSDEIDAAGVPNAMLFLEWQNGVPGCVNGGLPWDHQGYKARINALEQAHSELAKTWPAYPGEEEIGKVRHQYDRLRATLERVIQDVVFNGVVKRYRDWIRVDSLEDVVGFDRVEYEAISQLHKRSCDVVTAHDPSSDKGAAVPSATHLGNDIESLKEIVEMVKERRNAAKCKMQ